MKITAMHLNEYSCTESFCLSQFKVSYFAIEKVIVPDKNYGKSL